MHSQNNKLVQFFFRKNFKNLFCKFFQRQNFKNVLDVGSGTGFVKPIVENFSLIYSGVEPDSLAFNSACELYGEAGFINDYFPKCFIDSDLKFDLIFVLTCIDEVPNVIEFVKGLDNCMHSSSKCFIAVRNKDFIFNKFKLGYIKNNLKGRSKISLSDLNYFSWKVLFQENGFLIEDDGKYLRPTVTGINFAGLKNVIYKLISFLAPKEKSYMNYFILIKGNSK